MDKMAKTDKLCETLQATKVVSVEVVFVPKRVRAEWEKIELNELRECFFPEVSFETKGKKITTNLGMMAKVSPGDVPLGPAAEMLRSLVSNPSRVKLDRFSEISLKVPLVRIMNAVTKAYEEKLLVVLRDVKSMEQVQATLKRKRKKMVSKALQSVFRKAVNHMNTDEVMEIWNLIQVESVLRS